MSEPVNCAGPGGQAIRVVVADDYPVVREGIKEALCCRPGIVVVAEAHNATEALAQALAWQPDVLVLDVDMPGPTMAELVRRLQVEDHSPQILVLAPCHKIAQAVDLVEAGARAFLLKDSDPALIREAVRAVAEGQTFFSPPVTEYLVTRAVNRRRPGSDLTRREKQILRLMVRGISNGLIAAELNLSEQTIKNHVCRIYRKLGAGSRVEAVMLAVSESLIDHDGRD
jgi:DNA-binding NarL/FixJ family response regulator